MLIIKIFPTVQVILKDLEDCEAPVTALETLVSSSQSNKAQYERLHAEWKHLHKAARVRQKGHHQVL